MKILSVSPLSVGSAAVYQYSDALMEECARAGVFEDGEYNLARVVGPSGNQRIWVPRNMAPCITEDRRTDGVPVKMSSSFVPRNDEQTRVIDETVQLLAQGHNFMMEAPTGFGKTWCACDIIAQVGVKTIITITKEDIEDQWAAALGHLLGITYANKQLGLIKGDICRVAGCKVVIAYIQSIAKEDRYPPHTFNDFGLAIWDESGSPDTLVTTSVGQIRIQDLVQGRIACEALSFNTESEIYEWKRIVRYHEHPPKNPMMRVTHEHGYLDFTSEHLFYTDRGWLPVKELTPNDFIFLDSTHSTTYTNSKLQESRYEGVASRNSIRGFKLNHFKGWLTLKDSCGALRQAGSLSTSQVPSASDVGKHSPEEARKSWVGLLHSAVRLHITEWVAALLPRHLLQGWTQNSSAITCNAPVARVVSLVDDGRWGSKFWMLGASTEQVSRERRSGLTGVIENLFSPWISSESQRPFHSLYQRSKQVVKTGVGSALHSINDVQARWHSFWWKDSPVQSVWSRHSHEGRGVPQEGILSEGNLPKGKEVHELPPEVHSSVGRGQTEGNKVGGKVRVLSVAPIDTPALVYDIEVEGNHNFVANGVLVHNCHRVGADFFSQSAFRIPARLRLGISATPDRKDGKEEVLRAHIGPLMVKTELAPMTPRVIARKSPWKIPLSRQKNAKTGQYFVGPIPHSAGKCGHITKMLSHHDGRNQMLIHFAAQAYKAGRRLLIQSDLTEHLHTLMTMLGSAGIPQTEMAYYVGGMTKAQREQAKTKQVIFATYAMTAEATDIPDRDTLIMATPKSDVRQIVGRVLRFLPDKKEPLVFDVIDATSSVFSGYWNKRKTWYGSVNAEVDLAA